MWKDTLSVYHVAYLLPHQSNCEKICEKVIKLLNMK